MVPRLVELGRSLGSTTITDTASLSMVLTGLDQSDGVLPEHGEHLMSAVEVTGILRSRQGTARDAG
jgi:hypothetical protein